MRSRVEKLALVLEGQIFVVCGEIGLGALPSERKLANIGEMFFAGVLQRVGRRFGRLFRLRRMARAMRGQNDSRGGSEQQQEADYGQRMSAHFAFTSKSYVLFYRTSKERRLIQLRSARSDFGWFAAGIAAQRRAKQEIVEVAFQTVLAQ